MLAKNVAAERLNFALKSDIKSGSLKAQIQATNARKKRGDGKSQDSNPFWNKIRTSCPSFRSMPCQPNVRGEESHILSSGASFKVGFLGAKMESVSVRWRPSGGRGEFEYVPADSLEGKAVNVFFEALDLTIPAEVRGVNAKSQGKPRLRKTEPNNRNKLHLPQLVMAVARLPEPRREDHQAPLIFPLENKSFVMDAMDFDIVEDDGITVTLAPLRVTILHTNFAVELQDRFAAIAKDVSETQEVAKNYPKIANAITSHADAIMIGVNSRAIRTAADNYIKVQTEHFGMTNAGSATNLILFESLPETDLEDEIVGKEGRMLTRVHAYKERDRKFANMTKKHYKIKNGGKLWCIACDLKPETLYDDRGDRCIEAHHKTPIEELQPDSITRVDDMAMVCASCHRVIHSRKPCLTIEEVRALRPQTA